MKRSKKKLYKHFSLLLALLLNALVVFSQQSINLGDEWLFRNADSNDEWLRASVPGTVHTDLFADGKIPDPYTGCNNVRSGWIDTLNWEYQRKFNLPESFNLNRPIYLVFDGLDTYAHVYLNDSLILLTNNMFRQWRKDCATILKRGTNSLRVIFVSAVNVAKQEAANYKYSLPGGEWAFTRKSPYHFGWDWGPRFVTCGIWQPVYLYQPEEVDIRNVAITTIGVSEDNAIMNLDFDYSLGSGNYELRLIDTETNVHLIDTVVDFEVEKGRFQQRFNIENPQLWWPNGMGNQHLYNFRLKVARKQNIFFDKVFKVGVRTVELVNAPDSIGETFFFKVNGKPMFAKGANVIPPHSFLPSVSNAAWISIAEDARKSNFNMVRVWGGGAYPPDVFMQACTERGILVWQDFMFACSMYPWNSEFLQNVKVEAEQQVKRLRAHTCLALWCGNNEVDEGWHNWGWKSQFEATPSVADSIWNGYNKLFGNLLPYIVSKYDSTVSYWPSSPKFGWGQKTSMTNGDSHYWGVWWGKEPFAVFQEKVPRFMSEYGFQGAPSIQTVKLFSNDGALPDSVEMLCHQKHSEGYQIIKAYMERNGFNPSGLDEWIYASQITQAIGYKTAIEAQRLASPRCMGTLYWQLNDCWPVVSWSGIDYLGRWKAIQYAVRNCYRKVLVASQADDSVISVRAVTDSLFPVSGKISVAVLSTYGDTLKLWSKNITLQPNIAVEVGKISNPIAKINSNKYFLLTKMSLNNGQEFESFAFFGKTGNLQTQYPQISTQVIKNSNGGTVVLSSKCPAFFVELSSNNSSCRFENNYFHILPGEKYLIKYSGVLGGGLKLNWLNKEYEEVK